MSGRLPRSRREQHGAHDLVPEAMGELREGVGRRGHDEECVATLRKGDVPDLELLGRVQRLRQHGRVGDGLERERTDEPLRIGGHRDLNVGPGVLQPADGFDGLVGRDASAHADVDRATLQRG